MRIESSGNIYRVKLDHNLGFAYSQMIDFSDLSTFQGWLIYVFNLITHDAKAIIDIDDVIDSGVALGPLVTYKPIATKGIYAWPIVGKTDRLMTEVWPQFKEKGGGGRRDIDWSKAKGWYLDEDGRTKWIEDYDEGRRLERRILQTQPGIANKMSMKVLIDHGKKVKDYYDLSDGGLWNMFEQLINTYYPQEMVERLLLDNTPEGQLENAIRLRELDEARNPSPWKPQAGVVHEIIDEPKVWRKFDKKGLRHMTQALRLCYPHSDYVPVLEKVGVGAACWRGERRDTICFVTLVQAPGEEVRAEASSLPELVALVDLSGIE